MLGVVREVGDKAHMQTCLGPRVAPHMQPRRGPMPAVRRRAAVGVCTCVSSPTVYRSVGGCIFCRRANPQQKQKHRDYEEDAGSVSGLPKLACLFEPRVDGKCLWLFLLG
jgi:hypothetical protein